MPRRLFRRADKKEKDKTSAIHNFALNNNAEAVKKMLTKNPMLRSAKDASGWEPLHYACNAGAIQVIEVLLNWGADPNAVTDALRTPLHFAVEGGFVQVSNSCAFSCHDM
jgi:ankyrin repeat protein